MSLNKVKVLYRASNIQYPLVFCMEKWNLWENNGLDVELILAKDAAEAEVMLESGQVDYVFGNHITPYNKYFIHKLPYVYLGQTVKYSQELVVTRTPISSVDDLCGKSVYKEPYKDERGECCTHPALHVPLYLERAGVLSQVFFAQQQGRSTTERIKAVREGIVDFTLVTSSAKQVVQRQGLHTFALEPLPIVVGITLTSLRPRIQENPERAKQILRTLKQSLECFRTYREDCVQVLKDKVAPKLGLTTDEEVNDLYDSTLASLIFNLIPSPQAILNVYKEACLVYPEISGNNPMELWDLHFAQELMHE